MPIDERLRQLVRFHREHGTDYIHLRFGQQSMLTMIDEMEEAADRIVELEAALKLIASGMRGDRVLEAWELSDIAARATKAKD